MYGTDTVKITVTLMKLLLAAVFLPILANYCRSSSPCIAALVSDDIVDHLYGNEVTAALQDYGYTVYHFVFPHGEENKNMEQLSSLLSFLAESHLSRSDLIVALGGGVTGDLQALPLQFISVV